MLAGKVARTPDEAAAAFTALGTPVCAVKAQIHAGGLVGGAGDLAGEHGNAGCSEEVFGLKLMDLHRVGLAAGGKAD